MAAVLILVLSAIISTSTSILSSTWIEYINNVQNTWTAGHNELTNKSLQYKRRLCGALTPHPETTLPIQEDNKECHTSIPAAFDARKNWSNCFSINRIANQGRCGSCWAVATATAASDRFCIASNGSLTVNISAENLMSCCSRCYHSDSCRGGYPHEAWAYVKTTGVVTGGYYNSNEGCQPYRIPPSFEIDTVHNSSISNKYVCHKMCTNKEYERTYSEDLHFATRAYTLKIRSVRDMQLEIMNYGPIVATFRVYKDFFAYKSGVYKRTLPVYVGKHAVRVLGWGTTAQGVDYWLAANSWGKKWGKNGFFKILRGTNECHFEEFITAGKVKPI